MLDLRRNWSGELKNYTLFHRWELDSIIPCTLKPPKIWRPHLRQPLQFHGGNEIVAV